MKNLFVINESERSRILNMHITATKKNYLSESKQILNEGIPGLNNAIKVGFKQGFEEASLLELKKMLKQSNPGTTDINDLFVKFEDEYLASATKDDVIEKYFKNTTDDALEDFITILVKQNPSKFARYSADAVMGGEFSRAVRYAAERGESYSAEQLEKIKRQLESYINNLDDTDPFTLEVKHTFENEYLKKIDDRIESKKGASSSTGDRPVNDFDFGGGTNKFEEQIDSYLPPNNRWDNMGDKFGSVPAANRLTSEYVRELNKLEKKINSFDGTLSPQNTEMFIDFIEAYTSTKMARDINAKQLERMYRALSSKLSPEQASVLKKFSDVASGKLKLANLGKTGNKNIDNFLNVLGSKADDALSLGTGILRKARKFGKYSGEWLVAGIIVYIILSQLSSIGESDTIKPYR